MALGFTRSVADRALTWQPPDAASHARADVVADRAVLDTIACALAARSDPTVLAAARGVGALAPGSATVLGAGGTAAPRDAALLGGTAAHALDFDDVDDAMIGHPSTVIVPALLAVAEQHDLTGRAVVDAYGVGLLTCRDVADRLGIAQHYAAGWHATGTIGALGAAAALARLRGLDLERTRHALGIAASTAAGSRQNFGTMTKPLHAGVAASNAVVAVDLAAAGFTADPDQLEGPFGYLRLHGASPEGDATWDLRVDGPGEYGLNVKRHPCCYYIHCAADAALDLLEEGVRAEDVEQVLVTAEPGGLAPLIHHRPRTGLQGKFSMEYGVAAALLDGRLALAAFTDDAVRRPEAQELLRTVQTREEELPPVDGVPGGWSAIVEIRTRQGRVHSTRVDHPRGHARRPMSEDDLVLKARDCLDQAGLDRVGAETLIQSVRSLSTAPSVREALAPVRELSTALSAAGVGG